MQFEWDPKKAIRNFTKHGIQFEEAATIFNTDPNSIILPDPKFSGEERYVELGFSARGRLLVVVYTQRNDRIRIISARFPTRNEEILYVQR
jgi:uncharacterized protein